MEIVARHSPDLLSLARDTASGRWLTDEESGALTNVLVAVFLAHDDQPGKQARATALEADDLAGRIEMQRRGYWRS